MSAGDRARVSVAVAVEPADAFRVFTEQIDQWWRRGLPYRIASGRGVVHLEPREGGRLFESFESDGAPVVVDTGRVIAWEPPARLVLAWRAVNFAPEETTEVEVVFEPSRGGTLVTVTHSGWSRIRPDHPVRHGRDTAGFLRELGMWWAALLTGLREHVA